MKRNRYPLENLFGRILGPFEEFLKRTTAGGIVLMVTTVLALIVANLPWGAAFHDLWEQSVTVGLGGYRLTMSLHHVVNEGLMALFFLLVGLELKRELMVGELSSPKQAILPVIAAAGGMIVPAAIYFVLNPQGPAASGWGIPTATDIAFAVGILVLLARRIPRNLVVFLTALAIADDLGAVLIIAVFYTKALHWGSLGYAFLCLLVLVLFNRGGIRNNPAYGAVGLLLWLALLKSGIHATMAGVVLAFTIPAKPAFAPDYPDFCLAELPSALRRDDPAEETEEEGAPDRRAAVVGRHMERLAHDVQSPQQRLEHALAPWATFVVIPLFALANAGISFSHIGLRETLAHPVAIGVILGLVAGKFIGISGASLLAIRFGLAGYPAGVTWRHICGVGWLGGIGFTMSIFISQLAFAGTPDFAENAKLGILLGSSIAAVVGTAWLYVAAPPDRR